MEEFEGFGFDEFSVEMEDFKIKQVKTFDRMWKISKGGSILQIPIINDDKIYFGSCNHNVHAVDIRNGELAWKFRTEGIILMSSPSFWKGRIFIGSHDHNLYCLDALSGKFIWKFRTQGEVSSIPLINDGLVYFTSRDHNLYCLDAETGVMKWKFQTRDEVASSPTIKDGNVFIGSYDHNLYKIDVKTGEMVWKFQAQGEIVIENEMLIHGGTVYFSSFDNNLYAVDEETGKLRWKHRTGSYGNYASPVLHRGVLYHPSRDGFLFALTPDGKELWRFKKKHPVSLPSIAGDRIYIGCEDKNLYCLDLQGNEMWKFQVQGFVWIQPVVNNGIVYFPSNDCNLYAVDTRNQKLLWKFRADGSPSYSPPAYDVFQLVVKTTSDESPEEQPKRYDLETTEEDNVGFYKSKIVYRFSSRYQEKGKYQVNSDEESF